jgi:hypothetical protein
VEINKSTRHQKIIGDYGEALVCNWFSRSGFEVTIVDHTGIDVVAYNPKTRERFGVTVKSRTRDKGREVSSVNILSKNKSDRQKLNEACKAFACEPWIAIFVESTQTADLYVLSLDHYDKHYKGTKERVIDVWKMTDVHKNAYARDPDVKHIHMDYGDSKWDWKTR